MLRGQAGSVVRIRRLCTLAAHFSFCRSDIRMGTAVLASDTGCFFVWTEGRVRTLLWVCWTEERRARLDLRRGGLSFCFFSPGMLARSSSISNCLWIRNALRSFALGNTLARIVTKPVDCAFSPSSSFTNVKLGRRRLSGLTKTSAVEAFPKYTWPQSLK
jgi:hypothetical protein